MSKIETNQVDPATGTTLTLGTSGDTITIPSGVTIANSGTATGFGGANTPYFMVKKDSDQTISNNSTTKVTYDSTVVESSSNVFDLSNNKFTVVTAGKYQISPQCTFYDSSSSLQRSDMYIYKNGTKFQKFTHNDTQNEDRDIQVGSPFLVNLSASDYIEVYVYAAFHSGSSSLVLESEDIQTYLSAIKIIE
tara:strand:+ start:417 stop:992 length:576 start_codon:yes stop_codon:yes gene_type:complete